MKGINVSVILPTLNERENIVPLMESINSRYHPLEILVIDDNSSDGTSEHVQKYASNNLNVRLKKNNPPLGLAASIQQGISFARGEYILWMDADFSHPPKLIESMMKHTPNADIVVGSWLIKGGEDKRKEAGHKLFSKIINKACQVCFGQSIHAYTSGYILAKKSIFKNFQLEGSHGEYCISFLVKQMAIGKKIVEVPFVCVSRQNGKTKTAPNILVFLKHGGRYLKTIIALLAWKHIKWAHHLSSLRT